MKTITAAKATLSPDGKTLTAVFDVADQPFNALLTTRVSHTFINPLHSAHHRRIQSSNAAVFCESRQTKAAILNEALAEVFAALDPATTFAPQLKQYDGKVNVISETPVTLQWQVSDDGKTWSDIPGATGPTLDDAATKPGQWSQLVITNSTGRTVSQPCHKPSK